VLNAEDGYLRSLSVPSAIAVVSCGLHRADATWQAGDIQENCEGSTFNLRYPGGNIRSQLALSGRHNISNALQAIAAAATVGVDASVAAGALATFRGTSRRFQVVGEAEGVLVIDDYAHNPPKIRAALSASRARFPGRRVVAIFQPHTYSRTKLLFDDFVTAFDDADSVVLTEIYASRETDTLGITSNMLGNALATRLGADRVTVVGDWAKITTEVAAIVRADDLVLTLGAGTITEVGPRLLEALNARGLRYRA
jgi:UDP-N-acetylmuramate--alanine ligase